MALKSSTFTVQPSGSDTANVKKEALLERHRKSVEKVVSDAKLFSDDRKRKLSRISDKELRESAAR